jgi:hypothetical protein
MPFFEYIPLLFGGGNSLLNSTQILVEHDYEIRFPVIPFYVERLAWYSDQLVQSFSEPVELPTHGFVLGFAGRRIVPLGLQRKVHLDLVVLGVGPGVGFLESVVFPLAVAGRHDPAPGRNLDGEHVPTPARLDKEELFFDPATGSEVASAGTVVRFARCSVVDTSVSRFAEASAWRGGGIHLPRANSE